MKTIYAAAEQYNVDTFIQKFPSGADTIRGGLTLLAFEDYAKDLWKNNWSRNTPNASTWSIDHAFDTYRKILSEFSGDPAHPLSIEYDLDNYFVESHLSVTGNTDYLLNIMYDQVEMTTPNVKLPRYYGGQMFNNDFFWMPSSVVTAYNGDNGISLSSYRNSRLWYKYNHYWLKGFLGAWVLYYMLPPGIRNNIVPLGINHSTGGVFPDSAFNFDTIELSATYKVMQDVFMTTAIRRYGFVNIKTYDKAMNFNEAYISKDRLNDPSLAGDTIYYCVEADAPLTGLLNIDGSPLVVTNPELQYTSDFWSRIFSDNGLKPLLQGVAAMYPVGVTSFYDTKSTAAFNNIMVNVNEHSSFWTHITDVDYNMHSLINKFTITIDNQRRIFVVYTRYAAQESIHVKLVEGTFWGNFLKALIMVVIMYFAITLLGPGSGAGGSIEAGGMSEIGPVLLEEGGTSFLYEGTLMADIISTGVTGAEIGLGFSPVVADLAVIVPEIVGGGSILGTVISALGEIGKVLPILMTLGIIPNPGRKNYKNPPVGGGGAAGGGGGGGMLSGIPTEYLIGGGILLAVVVLD